MNYPQNFINQILNGDCFDLLPSIPNKAIDAIITDPPFSTTQCKWDCPVDLKKLWDEYKRIIKDNGAIVMFAQTPFDKVLGCSNLEWLRYEWIWEKTNATGFFNAKKMPMKAHENILVWYHKLPKFNPQKTTGHSPRHSYTKSIELQNKTTVYGKSTQEIIRGGETDRFPRSIITFASDKQRTKLDGTIHPTQKPLALLEYLVKSYTDENDLVLDSFAGSGTTGLACKNLNRRFIMIEKEIEYVNLSKKRIG